MHLHTDSHWCTCTHEHAQTVTQTVSHSVLTQSLSQGYSPARSFECVFGFTCVWSGDEGGGAKTWPLVDISCYTWLILFTNDWFDDLKELRLCVLSVSPTQPFICLLYKKTSSKCLISCISYACCGFTSLLLWLWWCAGCASPLVISISANCLLRAMPSSNAKVYTHRHISNLHSHESTHTPVQATGSISHYSQRSQKKNPA